MREINPNVEVEHADSGALLCGVAFHMPSFTVYVADPEDTADEQISEVVGWTIGLEKYATNGDGTGSIAEYVGLSSEHAAVLTAQLITERS
jgi:hypothetical protein